MTKVKDNKITYVDLSTKKVISEEIKQELRKKYIGGPGINTKILFDSEAMKHDALSEKNTLIFGAGGAVGTGLLASNRCTITSKSPLTDMYGDSNVGGDFPLCMRSVGIDHLVFTGKASTPVYVHINQEGKVNIIDASDLWGTWTDKVTEILQERYGKNSEVACIGPAGENLIRFASVIMSKNHVAGRTGMGCVMGSKNLKAIVIERKKATPPIYDLQKISEIRKLWLKTCKSSMLAKNANVEGTLFLTERYNKIKHLPIQNCQKGHDERAEQLYPSQFKFEYEKKKKACYACPIACGKEFEVKEGKYKGIKGERIDYGAIVSVGPACGIYDWPSIIHLKLLTDYFGLDTIELGGVLSLILECLERGKIDKALVEGKDLKFGNADDVEYLIRKIASREDIGEYMAEGTHRAAKSLNIEEYAMCVKKSSTGTHAKARLAWSLGYITSTRGGDHLKNFPFSMLFGGYFSDMVAKYIFNVDAKKVITTPEKKGRVVWWHENYKYIVDSLGLCIFAVHSLPNMGEGYFNDFAEVMNGLYNFELNDEEVLQAGERIYQLQNAFNVGCGMTFDDYKWPVRKKEKDITDEYIEETTITVRDNPGMLPEYFQFRGLTKDGKPTSQRFKELGLDEYMVKAKVVNEKDYRRIPELLQEVGLNAKFVPKDKIKIRLMNKVFCLLIDMKNKKEKKEYMKKKLANSKQQ